MKYAPIETYTDLELALMVLLGYFGNGAKRAQALGDRYHDVQSLVQRILNTGTVPEGSAGGDLDPAKLDQAIDAVFDDTLDELRKEIVEKYGES